MDGRGENAPGPVSAGLGATASPGGSRNWGEVEEVLFWTWDELARYGPLRVRLYLERRPRRRGPGTVVEFMPEPHQDALTAAGSASGDGL